MAISERLGARSSQQAHGVLRRVRSVHDRFSARAPWWAWAAGVAVVLFILVTLLSSPAAGLSAVFSVVVATLGFSLPGKTAEGLVIGGGVSLALILIWTQFDTPVYTWAIQLLLGLIVLVWKRPRLADLKVLLPLSTTWLGLSFWVLGIIGAVLVLAPKVAAGRIVYLGYFTLIVLALLLPGRGKRLRDHTVGLTAVMCWTLAVLLLSGATSLFSRAKQLPGYSSVYVTGLDGRFWGGHFIFVHPNASAMFAVIIAVRIGLSGQFRWWQRIVALATMGLFMYVDESRTAALLALAAGVALSFFVVWRDADVRTRIRLRSRWWALLSGGVAAVLALLIIVGPAKGFFLHQRYGTDTGGPGSSQTTEPSVTSGTDVGAASSGRTDTFRRVGEAFDKAGIVDKALGTTGNVRGVLLEKVGNRAKPVAVVMDSSLVNAFRRGGILGLLVFLAAVAVLVVRSFRRGAPLTFAVLATAALVTIGTSSWLIAGMLWLMLACGEQQTIEPAYERAPAPQPAA